MTTPNQADEELRSCFNLEDFDEERADQQMRRSGEFHVRVKHMDVEAVKLMLEVHLRINARCVSGYELFASLWLIVVNLRAAIRLVRIRGNVSGLHRIFSTLPYKLHTIINYTLRDVRDGRCEFALIVGQK